ncbi:MAG: hypothetical protein OXC44_06525 [Proteobacteria bacterium]|nr:hypothetical protein [Pseudomonadota bacterium]
MNSIQIKNQKWWSKVIKGMIWAFFFMITTHATAADNLSAPLDSQLAQAQQNSPVDEVTEAKELLEKIYESGKQIEESSQSAFLVDLDVLVLTSDLFLRTRSDKINSLWEKKDFMGLRAMINDFKQSQQEVMAVWKKGMAQYWPNRPLYIDFNISDTLNDSEEFTAYFYNGLLTYMESLAQEYVDKLWESKDLSSIKYLLKSVAQSPKHQEFIQELKDNYKPAAPSP